MGGASSYTFTVDVYGRKHFVAVRPASLAGPDGLSFAREAAASMALAAAGVAPRIVYSFDEGVAVSEGAGAMLSDGARGGDGYALNRLSMETLAELGALLARVHQTPTEWFEPHKRAVQRAMPELLAEASPGSNACAAGRKCCHPSLGQACHAHHQAAHRPMPCQAGVVGAAVRLLGWRRLSD